MEPFSKNNIPVLILNNNLDELIFQQNPNYAGKTFANIETSFDDLQSKKDKEEKKEEEEETNEEEDVAGLCLWLKESLSHIIGKVTVSKRLSN